MFLSNNFHENFCIVDIEILIAKQSSVLRIML